MAYALVGLAGATLTAPVEAASSFWGASTVVHRAVTHSLVVAPAAAAVAAAWAAGERAPGGGLRWRAAAAVGAVGLVAVATAASGGLAGAVMALFCLALVAVAAGVARRTRLGGPSVFALALVGLVSHPFGDLLTGEPPALLYPLAVTPFDGRLAPFADPTLNLLGAFAVELTAVWLGVGVALWLTDVRPRLTGRVSLGAGYGAAVVLVPAPTMDLSYPFVFSVLAVGVLGTLPRVELAGRASSLSVPDRVTMGVEALAAVTVAVAAYAAAYLALAGGG
jgi:membrane-bound metal-dependent hydrolase YbcI (DUF457 family)